MGINTKNFALAGGILWAAAMLVFTWVSIPTGYGAVVLNAVASIYPGYTISWLGGIIGAIYGFIDMFIALYLFGWLYNKLEAK